MTPDRVRAAFDRQARACANLGSPFTAWVCARFASALDAGFEPDGTLLNWSGEPSNDGDSVPLRLCGALHWLAITGRDTILADLYARLATSGADWMALLAATRRNADTILGFVESPPQTNEVGRSAMIIAGLGRVASQSGLPLAIFEIGASAGLNLNCDRFGYRFVDRCLGDPHALVQLAPAWRGADYADTVPDIVAARGCDIRPIDPTHPDARSRLLAYIWPDQPDRLARMRAALDIATEHPVQVERADGVAWIAAQVAAPIHGVTRVIYSTVAWQYLPEAERAKGARLIAEIGAAAQRDSPLGWVRIEADGATPGAGMTLDWWSGDGGHDRFTLGRADFHGRWIDWQPIT